MNDRRDGPRDDGGRDGDEWTEDEDPIVGATTLLVLGLGLASLFGLVPIEPFWLVFVIGFAVVVPLVALLRKHRLDSAGGANGRSSNPRAEGDADEPEFDDALARIRDRYARGELSEEQFERKLELLLETETPEDARERVRRVREGRARRETEAEAESES